MAVISSSAAPLAESTSPFLGRAPASPAPAPGGFRPRSSSSASSPARPPPRWPRCGRPPPPLSCSSRFSDLYLASFALTDSNLAFISSGSVAARPRHPARAVALLARTRTPSPTTWLRRCAACLFWRRRLRVSRVVLATCACGLDVASVSPWPPTVRLRARAPPRRFVNLRCLRGVSVRCARQA